MHMERLWLVSHGVAWIVLMAQGFALIALASVIGRIYIKRSRSDYVLITNEGPDLHAEMPVIKARDTQGRLICSSDYRGQEMVLLFLHLDCMPCQEILRNIELSQHDPIYPMASVVVLRATKDEAMRAIQNYRLKMPVILDKEGSIFSDVGVERTPYGFLIDNEGIVRMKGVINNRSQLESLIHRRGRAISGMAWESDDEPARAG